MEKYIQRQEVVDLIKGKIDVLNVQIGQNKAVTAIVGSVAVNAANAPLDSARVTLMGLLDQISFLEFKEV